MNSEPIRILLIEDDEDDYIITRDLLSSSSAPDWKLEWASTFEQGASRLASREHSIALVDFRLGAQSGLDLLKDAIRDGCDIPLILLTGLGAEEIDKAAMQAGAADYLVKGQISPTLLERSIRHAIQRKAAERELRASKEQYQLLFEQNPHPMFVVDESGSAFLGVNAAAERVYGYSAAEFLEMKPADLLPADQPAPAEQMAQLRPSTPLISRHRRKDGAILDVEITGNPISFQGASAFLMLAQDVTMRMTLEAHVRQAQKMESMGALAGGVAHDFNNLLAIISGHAWRARENVSNPQTVTHSLTAIDQAVSRGAGIVRQILTFARKTAVEAEPLKVEALVTEFVRMISETFPKEISIRRAIEAELPPLVADSNQVHQALLNLCVNARDAMSGAGEIRISAKRVHNRDLPGGFPKSNGSGYIRISVSDTGAGMDDATRRRIFEPFFTTKGSRGTGLGLAVVYGILKAHSGLVDVESAPGQGSAFHLYFPIVQESCAQDAPPVNGEADAAKGSETILLVEDEDLLRELMQTILESKGYKVLTAADGHEGLEVFAKNRESIALLLADMGLPKLGGWEMYLRMRESAPHLRAIFASGYLEPELKTRILESGAFGFVQKPCLPNELYSRIREALGAPA